MPLFVFLASRSTKESGWESKDEEEEEEEEEEEGNNSDASSSSQNHQNGDTKSNKKRTKRQAAKTKGNGEKCPHQSLLYGVALIIQSIN